MRNTREAGVCKDPDVGVRISVPRTEMLGFLSFLLHSPSAGHSSGTEASPCYKECEILNIADSTRLWPIKLLTESHGARGRESLEGMAGTLLRE
jgi:hypothetical protein